MVASGLIVVVAGVWAFRQLKLEAYPDISDTGVVVITPYPGFAAEEVEQQVTVPIERALNNTPNVIARRSRTIFGLSVVELTFADGTDDYFARQVVLEHLRDAELPDGVTPTLGPLSTGIGELYRYILDGTGYDAMQLREIQDWVITPRLLQVPGVADVVDLRRTGQAVPDRDRSSSARQVSSLSVAPDRRRREEQQSQRRGALLDSGPAVACRSAASA